MIADWLDKLKQLDSIPIALAIDQIKGDFHFQSMGNATVYGRFFQAKQPKKQMTVCLYHGLFAHTMTSGYQEIAQMWQSYGFDVIGFDVRNQGGKTNVIYDEQTSAYGLYVSGILSNHYYYHDVYLDSLRIIDVARLIFPTNKHIIATGGSQGGSLAIFAGIMRKEIDVILADMPSNIDIVKLMHTKSGHASFLSYFNDYPNYQRDVIKELELIDLMSYKGHLKKPTLLSSGDQDEVCPLEHTLSFYDALSCTKDIHIYKGYGHGGYDHLHFPNKLAFLHRLIK